MQYAIPFLLAAAASLGSRLAVLAMATLGQPDRVVVTKLGILGDTQLYHAP